MSIIQILKLLFIRFKICFLRFVFVRFKVYLLKVHFSYYFPTSNASKELITEYQYGNNTVQ